MNLRAVVLVIVLGVGCAPLKPDVVTTGGPPPGTVAAPQHGDVAADGRPVERGAAQWCFQDSQGTRGGSCSEEESECTAQLKKARYATIVEYMSELRRRIGGSDPDRLTKETLAHTNERWPPCALTRAMGCYRVRDVLTGVRATACGPTVQSCEDGLRADRRNRDIVVESTQCFVLRAD